EIFSDLGFNGQTKEIKINIHGKIDLKNTEPHSVFLEIISLSPQFYEYQKSFTEQILNSADPFAEAIPVFSNIQNGYGIFAGFNSLNFELQF
ncbi:MAG TPA: DUF4249 family protein, partial [Bacteroidetes bacterium]|nr:DUF4249 family protein [Bacteroidota bacterium]